MVKKIPNDPKKSTVTHNDQNKTYSSSKWTKTIKKSSKWSTATQENPKKKKINKSQRLTITQKNHNIFMTTKERIRDELEEQKI